jgi:hypothetical protein
MTWARVLDQSRSCREAASLPARRRAVGAGRRRRAEVLARRVRPPVPLRRRLSRSDTGPAPQSIPFASRVCCLVALGARRRTTALRPGLLAAGPASSSTLLSQSGRRERIGEGCQDRSPVDVRSQPLRSAQFVRGCPRPAQPRAGGIRPAGILAGDESRAFTRSDRQVCRQRRGSARSANKGEATWLNE